MARSEARPFDARRAVVSLYWGLRGPDARLRGRGGAIPIPCEAVIVAGRFTAGGRGGEEGELAYHF